MSNVIVVPLLKVILLLISLFKWALIIYAIMSWLIALNVVNTQSPLIYKVNEVLYRLTEPALKPLRNILPYVGGLDLSFLALYLIIFLVENFVIEIAKSLLT